MSDSTNSSSQQTIVIALVVVAVLLAALVGVLVYQQSQAAKLAAPVVAAPDASQNPAGMGGAAGGTGAAAPGAAAGPFDPKTATKVPAGIAPLAFLKAYNEDIIAGKFDAAYKMLPLDKQQSYGDANSYASQVKGYGISGYKLGKPVEKGDTMSIATLQENPAMPITYTWNFKKVGDTWYVESRVMGGSVE